MGAMADLPAASSPSLILTHPTDQERLRTWSQTHPKWGPALSLHDYLDREAYLTTVPLAKDGGITHWILTDSSLPPDQRPILSSCETLRKPALSCAPAGPDGGEPVVVDGIAHGLGSVFTAPQFRGMGYASRMMREVGVRLRRHQAIDAAATTTAHDGIPAVRRVPLFSVLYSDIGKKFYARNGWAPFASAHVSFPPATEPPSQAQPSRQNGHTNGGGGTGKCASASPIGYHELAELCAVDEKLLRAALRRRAGEGGGGGRGRTCVALLPNLDAILWHLMREDFMTKHIFGRTPVVRGAVYGKPGRRVWAVWTRGYYGGLEKMEGNTLHVLRFVVEDESDPEEEYLVDGIRSIVRIAQAEAAEWRSQDVQMWNPTPKLRELIEKSGLPFEFVDRDSDSIASLMWYGEGPTCELDWVINEKFAWC